MPIRVIRDPSELQRKALELKRAAKTIGVVPTMGALHDGHRALIAEARGRCDILIVTLFVNPTQFGPNEDLDAYPSTFDADLAMCEAEGADFLFFPAADAMYPEGYATYVSTEDLTQGLCGRSRPTHFRGVTTIVAKLLLITQADIAVFGWKDAQQLLVIRRMTEDLHIPAEIIGVETVREPDGLAMSTRNTYLTAEQRAEAPALHRALQQARCLVEQEAETNAQTIIAAIRTTIERETSARIDYVEIVSQETLQPIPQIEPDNTLIALAAHFGETRLIDNTRI